MFDTLTYARLPQKFEALRQPLRTLIAEHVVKMTPAERSRSWMGFDRDFSRRLGKAGYLGLTLPERYGGRGLGPLARFVVVEELLALGAPVAAHWMADRQSAPLILRFGTEAQRERYLPGICRGELVFSVGLSEPGSGSDLASIRTKADRTDKGWLLNGQKVWTSNATGSDYMIALVRTSGTPEDRQVGLSQLIVDLRSPGVTIRPIKDLAGDEHFAEVFFDNVALGDDALVGSEGGGWAQVNAELAFERAGPERIYTVAALLDTWIAHLHQAGRTDTATMRIVGRLTAQLVALRAFALAVTMRLEAGESPATEAALVKDFGTSFEQSVPIHIADDLAAHPEENIHPDLHDALRYVTHMAPSYSLRGGTREILRGIIARGLGLR